MANCYPCQLWCVDEGKVNATNKAMMTVTNELMFGTVTAGNACRQNNLKAFSYSVIYQE